MKRFKYHIVITSFILSGILWISLNLNQTYEIDKSIPVKIEVNKPFAVSGNIPLFIEVKFRGVGWSLIRLFTSFKLDLNYKINAKRNEQFTIITKDYITHNYAFAENLSISHVFPETLFIKVDNYEEKYIKLQPRLFIECREGYQVVGNPILEPDSIKIGGSVEILNSLKFIPTKEEKFTSVNSSIVKLVSVSDSLSNIIWHSQIEVKLIANVELSAEKELHGIEITVSGLPDDKEVLLIPQSLNIRLRGGVNQLEAIDNSKIRAVLSYQSILSDSTGSVIPELIIPAGCILSQVLPEKIQYIIKKKS
ncbi:MAG TPA: hypothetical protein VJ455_03250 [Ignavibacteria bacterium]|nr:hypothetical protein [Ignavibacteria bacterium]